MPSRGWAPGFFAVLSDPLFYGDAPTIPTGDGAGFQWLDLGLPRFLPGAGRVQPAPMCRCDMFPEPHPDGYAADGVVCELALPGVRISPHLILALSAIWADADISVTAAPPLSEEATRQLRATLNA